MGQTPAFARACLTRSHRFAPMDALESNKLLRPTQRHRKREMDGLAVPRYGSAKKHNASCRKRASTLKA
eukprot:CAMPEP_0115354606 /NCGR_PEP_ID=MMETSP0270-20121206/98675_1 /TAXON_ID=71861 /ORGANISM="Scrippsiella trochoidea, Strain CCMP3099" /LENGTH=68 /DNA_ID=CAMNT_0002776949 /DNA_START=29 /DNA_END=235 /DNA_ORIENTATION=+